MRHPRSLFAAILLGFSLVLSAQTDYRDGYIITLDQDTLRGQIDFRSEVRNSRICHFREYMDAEPKSFAPGEISAYRFTPGKYYVTKTIDVDGESRTVFAEYLVNGIADLYFYRDDNNDLYLIEKEGGEMLALTNEEKEIYVNGERRIQQSNRYIRLLKATFSDCMEIQSRIDAAQLSHRSLISVTSSYHEYVCEGEKCIIYEKETSGIQVGLGVTMGYQMSRLRIKGDDLFESFAFENSFDPAIGFVANISSYRLRDKLSFLVGAEFSRNQFLSAYDRTYTYWTWVNHYRAELTTSSLYMYTGPVYRMSAGQIRPRISAGLAFQKFLGPDFHYELEVEYLTHSEFDHFEGDVVDNMLFGAYAQAGVEMGLGAKRVLFADIRGGFLTSNPNILAGLDDYMFAQLKLRPELIQAVLTAGIRF